MLETIQVAIGGVLAVAAMIAVEWLRKPQVVLELAPHSDDRWEDERPAKSARFVRVKAVNKALPGWARWMCRNTALQCHGTITFHYLDGQNVFGREMPIRWTDTLEPTIKTVNVGGSKVPYIDPRAFPPQTTKDIYAGESEAIDIAGRLDDDEACYGWNNDSYSSNPVWRNSKWKIDKGRYIVRVEVLTGGVPIAGVFRLLNDVDVTGFRLEEAQPEDRRALAKASGGFGGHIP